MVSPGSADSDGESPPKRANTKPTNDKLPTSDSSMEVGEIQPALQQTQKTVKARASRKKTGATGLKAKAPVKNRKLKSQEYVEDSDDDEECREKDDKETDEPKVVPGACIVHTIAFPSH